LIDYPTHAIQGLFVPSDPITSYIHFTPDLVSTRLRNIGPPLYPNKIEHPFEM